MQQAFKLVLANLLVLFGLLLLVELALRVGAWVTRDTADDGRYGTFISAEESLVADVVTFRTETTEMMTNMQPHPHRWYQLPQVNHTYTTTDARGFRVTPQTASPEAPIQIGFFGGSTMFSVTTADEGSLPAQFAKLCENPDVYVHNFGIAGYSSSAELATLIEVLRVQNLDYAVFYDGVNEVGRYIEVLQNYGATPPAPYDVVGFPYDEPRFTQIDFNQNLYGRYPWLQHIYLARLVTKLAEGLSVPALSRTQHNPTALLQETPELLDVALARIATIYRENLQDIRSVALARGTIPLFFYQPNVFTKANLSAEELVLYDRANPLQRQLHNLLDTQDWARDGVVSLIDAVGDTPTQVYGDDVHGGVTLNRLVAQAMLVNSPALQQLCR